MHQVLKVELVRQTHRVGIVAFPAIRMLEIAARIVRVLAGVGTVRRVISTMEYNIALLFNNRLS